MILQPEGVELVPEDFAGFLGAGNPLASALRGTREYYARQAAEGRTPQEPYPLLLVRPDGIMSYYAARSALGSWGADFGYELIGSDWNLKFAPPDERLAQLLRQIVTDARRRMRELMLVTNQFKAQSQRVALRASSNGGFVADRRHTSGRDNGPRGSGSGWDSLDSTWASGKSRAAANRSGEQGDGFGDGGSASGGGLARGAGGSGRSIRGSSNGNGAGTRYDPLMSGGPGGYAPDGNGIGNGNQPVNGQGYGPNGNGSGERDAANSQQASVGGTAGEGAGGGNASDGSAPPGRIGGQMNSQPNGAGKSKGDGAAGAAPTWESRECRAVNRPPAPKARINQVAVRARPRAVPNRWPVAVRGKAPRAQMVVAAPRPTEVQARRHLRAGTRACVALHVSRRCSESQARKHCTAPRPRLGAAERRRHAVTPDTPHPGAVLSRSIGDRAGRPHAAGDDHFARRRGRELDRRVRDQRLEAYATLGDSWPWAFLEALAGDGRCAGRRRAICRDSGAVGRKWSRRATSQSPRRECQRSADDEPNTLIKGCPSHGDG